jgi:aminoglycoside phosphotransferase (APT) family kinase protein
VAVVLAEQIARYLSHRLPRAREVQVSGLRRIPGGASRETWAFDASWEEDGCRLHRGFVIRRDPPASLLVTDRDVEFQVMAAVGRAGVPVPRVLWLETDGQYLERPFFVMERIDGCETAPHALLADPQYAGARPRLAERFVQVLASLHALDWGSLGLGEALGPPPAPSECARREIEKWEQVLERDALGPQPVLRAALRWLRRHLPPPAQRIVLVHGDYRVGNFLYDPQGEVRGVLDWEMAHLGDPLEDLAWACLRPWRWAGDERVGGLLERERFFRLYEELTGLQVEPEAVRFWEVLGNVKLATIFITGARALAEGKSREPILALTARGNPRLELEIMALMDV